MAGPRPQVPTIEASPAPRRVSVVLPIEGDGAGLAARLLALEDALRGEEHEILVCGGPDDVPFADGDERVPASVRRVRDRLARGPADAIRAGFRVASGDVVVTTTAAASDPVAVLPALAERVRSGAAVVVASRRGDGRAGNEPALARLAAVGLHRVAGLGTRDPASRVAAYSRRFLARAEVDGDDPSELALALAVQAHLAGEQVLEVPCRAEPSPPARPAAAEPAAARDLRAPPAGSCAPRWCWAALAAPLFVLAVWAVMLARALAFVAANASAIPFWDDLVIGPQIEGLRAVDARWLWHQHNEHRIPLPKLVYAALLTATHDVRSGMYAQVAILAALALACALAARRIRGRSSIADSFFPFLWLEVGNCENLLMGFQISLALPVAIATGVLLAVAAGRVPPRPRAASAIAAALVALPLCGGPGLLPLPPLAAWAVWAGVRASRAGERASARWLIGGALAAALAAGLYVVSFERRTGQPGYAEPARALVTAAQYASLALGGFAAAHWYACAALVGASVTLGLALLARRGPSGGRLRAGGLLAALAGMLALAAGIGFGRGRFGDAPGLALRYVVLAAPLLVWPYLVLVRYASATTRSVGCAALCLLAAATVVPNHERGKRYARERLAEARAIEADVAAGVVLEELARRHAGPLYGGREETVADMLATLRRIGAAPFGRRSAPTVETGADLAFLGARPVAVRAAAPALFRELDGARVAALPLPSELAFEVPAGSRTARARIGAVLADAPVELEAELLAPGDARARLEVRRDPSSSRFASFVVDLPEGAAGELVLRAVGGGGPAALALWAEVGFER